MTGLPQVRQGFEWYREGQHARALDTARRILATSPEDVNALHLAGLASARLGDGAAGMTLLQRALELAPAVPQLWLSEGKVLWELDRPSEALEAFARAGQLDPTSYHAHLELGLVQAKLDRIRDAAHSFLRAWRLRWDDDFAQVRLLGLLRDHPQLFPIAVPGESVPVATPTISVVICSVDQGRFARARESYSRALDGCDHELIGIHDARSLAEAYNRALDRCRGEIVVFSHDDIEVLSADLGGALVRVLGEADVAGVAGTTVLLGPAWVWGGRESSRGRIVQPAPDGKGWELFIFCPPVGIERGIQALDGVFIAARREAAQSVRFDSETFDGFHLYDIDFSYRAHLQGLRVAVTPDILVRHDSHGSFDDQWATYARRFVSKYPVLSGPPKRDYLPQELAFDDDREAALFCLRLDCFCRESAG